ncbi:MAG TPA: methyl-accepting chemotaxis protein [Spirochaetota bacterium]|nr:methyl-accepting chemotaxis protein [Spirochaetota bacterium]HPI88753.1 methyl-accepting chemotaxis protein [Spirochaetota bacterium]HPR47172.1 methyl-accepting chemotaxis protein [Spirochaetota bacterium]
MASRNPFVSFFLKNYSDASYIQKRKALTLGYYLISTSTVVFFMMIAYLVVNPVTLVKSEIAMGSLLVIECFALWGLVRGKYSFTANFITVAVALLLTAAVFAKVTAQAHTGYTTYFYLMLVIVVQAALFCTRKWLFGVTGFFIIADIVFFSLVRHRLDALSLEAATVGLLVSCFTFVFVLVLSYLIVSIAEDAMGRSDEEARINRENYAKIQGLLESVRDSSDILTRSSLELKNSITVFSDNFQSQAASAEEITATMEEITAGIDNTARGSSDQSDNIGSLFAKLGSLTGIISEMDKKIAESVGIVNSITGLGRSGESSLSSMMDSMQKINEGSNQMNNIVEIINSISDKINLLSLNAAIEAARAGDAGRGFAVVADEISKLADQTAQSLKEIDALIKLNIDEINRGSRTMQSTVSTLSEIITGVSNINSVFGEIADFMTHQNTINEEVNRQATVVQERSGEIKNATEEQKVAAEEIVKSISSVNAVTQQNSEVSGNLKSLSEDIARMAEALEESLTDYSES